MDSYTHTLIYVCTFTPTRTLPQVGRRYRLQWYSGQEDGSKAQPNRFPGTGLAAIDVSNAGLASDRLG